MSASESPDLAGTVLITVDSLRSDAVFGPRGTSVAPTLTSLSERGVSFEDAIAPGNWTPFSFPGILASRTVFADSTDVGVPQSRTLPEVLSEAGVETAGFNAANGFLTAHWGYDRGFDRFDSFVDDPGSGLYGRYVAPHPTVQGWLQLGVEPVRRLVGRLRGRSSDRIVDTSHTLDVERAASEFLASAGTPFFLWVHYMDPHIPYVPAGKHRRATGADVGVARMLAAQARAGFGWNLGDRATEALRALYRGAVHQTDDSIRRVLDALGRRGIRDDTCVVVTGDHGEAFGEHGHLAHYPTLYEELTNVPLIVDHPDGSPRTIETPTSLEAIPPTVCSAMDVEPSPAFRGRDLLSVVTDGASAPADPVTSVALRGDHVTEQPIPRRLEDGDLIVRARTSEWAYEFHAGTAEGSVYDRTDDGERELPVDACPASTLSELREAVTERLGRIRSDGVSSRRETPDGIDRQLAALGYQ